MSRRQRTFYVDGYKIKIVSTRLTAGGAHGGWKVVINGHVFRPGIHNLYREEAEDYAYTKWLKSLAPEGLRSAPIKKVPSWKTPRCFNFCSAKVRRGSLFCSDKCAIEFAENAAGEAQYCTVCETWLHGACSVHPEAMVSGKRWLGKD